MSDADDWSLTPATLARVASVETPEPTLDPSESVLAALDADPDLSLGINCCATCAEKEGDGAVECPACRSVVYCSEAHRAADADAHARVCRLLGFGADLAEVKVPDADAVAAATVKALVANLKLLGRETTRHLVGPRGYRADEDDDERDDDAVDEASREATAPRWRGLFKLSKSDACPALDATPERHGAEGCARAAAALRAHGEVLSHPLSVVAASWMFPVVKYALMLGARNLDDEDGDDDDAPAKTEKKSKGKRVAADRDGTAKPQPAHIHVVRAEGESGEAACGAGGAAWWLIGYGCGLDKPGAAVTVVGEAASSESSESTSRVATFCRGSYADFVDARVSSDAPGPCLVFAADLMRGSDPEGTLRAARMAGCPLLTANATVMELSVEQEALEDAGYELVGMERNPFAYPVPVQSPAMGNDVVRRNEWLAAYVPRGRAGSGGEGGGDAGAEASARAGEDSGGGKRRKAR